MLKVALTPLQRTQQLTYLHVRVLCEVPGWTNWSRCSASSCGGGRRQRVLYEIQTRTSYVGHTVIRPVAYVRFTRGFHPLDSHTHQRAFFNDNLGTPAPQRFNQA